MARNELSEMPSQANDGGEAYRWWEPGVIYHVYLQSFLDTNGDGVGDLRGVIEKLDYFTWLGVDAIWLSPLYPSPMADSGYDVSDYTAVSPLFGTLEDFDELLEGARSRGLRVILDFVPNHTSDQHRWFVESRSSRDNPKRDWYLWSDRAPDGGPPNNWLSTFGGSAWELDEATGQYYYHAFLREQPDLNWRNPEVRDAVLDCMRFWLSRGVDGFRLDVIWHVIKDELLRDDPPNPDYLPEHPEHHKLSQIYSTDRPEVLEVISAMRGVVEEYHGDRLLIGEVYLPVERLMVYYGAGGEGVHLPFNFQLVLLPWNAETVGEAIQKYEAALPSFGWPNWVLGNHDRPRVATRAGADQARVAAMLLLTLRGTPTIYYGDEIGMSDSPVPPDRVRDTFEKNVPGRGFGRDPQRTPMPWDGAQPNAGFTNGEPWLPLSPDVSSVNVASQAIQPGSVLSLYRALLSLRRHEPALSVGAYEHLSDEGDLLAYVRWHGESRWLIVLNFGAAPATFHLSTGFAEGRIELSTNLDREGEAFSDRLDLSANEGVVGRLL